LADYDKFKSKKNNETKKEEIIDECLSDILWVPKKPSKKWFDAMAKTVLDNMDKSMKDSMFSAFRKEMEEVSFFLEKRN
jgi:hypothetical protein